MTFIGKKVCEYARSAIEKSMSHIPPHVKSDYYYIEFRLLAGLRSSEIH